MGICVFLLLLFFFFWFFDESFLFLYYLFGKNFIFETNKTKTELKKKQIANRIECVHHLLANYVLFASNNTHLMREQYADEDDGGIEMELVSDVWEEKFSWNYKKCQSEQQKKKKNKTKSHLKMIFSRA